MATFGFFAILAALILGAAQVFSKGLPRWLVPIPLALGTLALWAEFIARTWALGFPALTGMFESLVFFSGALSLLLLVYPYQKKFPFLPLVYYGGLVVVLGLLALASSPLAPSTLVPPIPALKSGWLALHVSFAFIGEAFFAVSFVAALVYLLSRKEEVKKSADRLMYLTIALGYPLFTLGALIFGAVWAQYAWGRWWGWDPKETWALVTWLFYTFYLHHRLFLKKTGKVSAWLAVIGFVSTLFTFFGVNFLLAGLHSYGR